MGHTSFIVRLRAVLVTVLSPLPGVLRTLWTDKNQPKYSYCASETILASFNLCRSKPRLLWTVMNANNGQVQIYKHDIVWMNIHTLRKVAIPSWFQWTYKFDYSGIWSVTIVHVLSLPMQAVQGTWENVFSEKNTEQNPDRVTILNVVRVYVCRYKHL